jgi:hypothetical protein
MVQAVAIKKQKTKALVIARGVDIFRLLFDIRNDGHRSDLAKVVLPLVNQYLIGIENKEKAKKKAETLDKYSFDSLTWKPQVGSIVAKNALWRSGDNYRWFFFQITNITETGRIMVRQLEKKCVQGHLGNSGLVLFAYLKSYVAPTAGEYFPGGARMLAFGFYHVYEATSPMDSSFFDGCRDD